MLTASNHVATAAARPAATDRNRVDINSRTPSGSYSARCVGGCYLEHWCVLTGAAGTTVAASPRKEVAACFFTDTNRPRVSLQQPAPIGRLRDNKQQPTSAGPETTCGSQPTSAGLDRACSSQLVLEPATTPKQRRPLHRVMIDCPPQCAAKVENSSSASL